MRHNKAQFESELEQMRYRWKRRRNERTSKIMRKVWTTRKRVKPSRMAKSEVERLINERVPLSEIAKRYHTTTDTVRNRVRLYGLRLSQM